MPMQVINLEYFASVALPLLPHKGELLKLMWNCLMPYSLLLWDEN